MKTTLSLLICIMFFYNANSQFIDFSRIRDVNTNILHEFKEKKYKKAQKITRISIKGLYAFSEDTIIIETPSGFYNYIISTNELVKITNPEKIDELKQKIINSYIDIPLNEDSFTKKEAKEKAKETGKALGKGVLSVLTNVTIDVFRKNTMIISPDNQDSVKCFFSYYKYSPTVSKNSNKDLEIEERSFLSFSFSYFMDSLNSKYKINESPSSTENLSKKVLHSPQSIKLSLNSEYILFENYLFDLKAGKLYYLFDVDHVGIYSLFDYHCKNIIIFTDNPFRKEIMVDVIPIKEEWVKKLTERTDKEVFLAKIKNLNTNTDVNNRTEETGPGFTDNINGQHYKIVNIGMQTWMTENMNIGEMVSGKSKQKNQGKIEKYCYDNDERNCEKYGGLYQWDEAMKYNNMNARGICPEGWHIPTLEEWNILINFLGGKKQAGSKMKKEKGLLWNTYIENNNSSGFSAVPAGYRSRAGGRFGRLKEATYMRTSSSGGAVYLNAKDNSAVVLHPDKSAGFSVRCIKD